MKFALIELHKDTKLVIRKFDTIEGVIFHLEGRDCQEEVKKVINLKFYNKLTKPSSNALPLFHSKDLKLFVYYDNKDI